MDLRSYTKQELALLYFPDATPAVAKCSPDAMDPAHPRPSPEARRHRLRQELQGVHPDGNARHPRPPVSPNPVPPNLKSQATKGTSTRRHQTTKKVYTPSCRGV